MNKGYCAIDVWAQQDTVEGKVVYMCWRLLSAIKWEKTRFQDLVNEESITSDFIPRELPTSQFLMI